MGSSIACLHKDWLPLRSQGPVPQGHRSSLFGCCPDGSTGTEAQASGLEGSECQQWGQSRRGKPIPRGTLDSPHSCSSLHLPDHKLLNSGGQVPLLPTAIPLGTSESLVKSTSQMSLELPTFLQRHVQLSYPRTVFSVSVTTTAFHFVPLPYLNT